MKKELDLSDVTSILCGSVEKFLSKSKAKRTDTVIASYYGLPVIQRKGLQDDEVLLLDSKGRIVKKYII